MRAKWAGIVGLAAVTACLLTACGQAASSVKESVSSVAASRSVAVTQSAPAAPSTQAAPAQPTQAAPTQASSQAASSSAPVASAAASGTPAAGTGSGFPWNWFWLAVGIALVVGIAAVTAARLHKRRSAAAAGWQTRVIDAYAKGAALHDAMAAVEAPGALASADAAIRWSDIQRRADDYGELLYGMEQAAPGDQERLVVADVIASLKAARSAMDAERSTGIPDDSLSLTVRDRLAYFASALSSLRQPEVRPA